MMLIATYGVVAVLAAVLLTFWYLNTQEQRRIDEDRVAAARRKQIENAEQKEALLSRVQDRLVTVERNLIATNAGGTRTSAKSWKSSWKGPRKGLKGQRPYPLIRFPRLRRLV